MTIQPPQRIGTLAERVMASLPPQLRHTLEPAEVLLRVYGITPGWVCPGCGHVYELRDHVAKEDAAGRSTSGVCPSCRRPLPRRCITKGCAELVDPQPSRRGGKVTGWYDSGGTCERCERDATTRARLETWAAGVPKLAREGAINWHADTDWRLKLGSIAMSWERGANALPALYLHGPIGSGKTVAAAWLLKRVFMSLGPASFTWATERELLDAHRDRFMEGEAAWQKEKAAKAVDLIASFKSRPIVVLDELFSGGTGHYTDRQIDLVWELLAHRLENRLWTVLVSNAAYAPDRHRPEMTVWHNGLGHGSDGQRGEAMASRWAQLGEVLYCAGRDRRRVAPKERA